MQKNDSERPLILVTNDDGIHASGLRELVEVMQFFGDVVVISSEVSMSGKASSITVDYPLRAVQVEKIHGVPTFKCNGTPVDCVKLSFNNLLERSPDYVVSGINHGSNASISVIYSGTMGAAIEGSLHGVPSIGFSLDDYESKADFSACGGFIKEISTKVLKEGLSSGICLNVNIPAVPKEDIKGVRICRQAKARWVEQYEERADPRSRNYYWLTDLPG